MQCLVAIQPMIRKLSKASQITDQNTSVIIYVTEELTNVGTQVFIDRKNKIKEISDHCLNVL